MQRVPLPRARSRFLSSDSKVQLPCCVFEGSIVYLAATTAQIVAHLLSSRFSGQILIPGRLGVHGPPPMLQNLESSTSFARVQRTHRHQQLGPDGSRDRETL